MMIAIISNIFNMFTGHRPRLQVPEIRRRPPCIIITASEAIRAADSDWESESSTSTVTPGQP